MFAIVIFATGALLLPAHSRSCVPATSAEFPSVRQVLPLMVDDQAAEAAVDDTTASAAADEKPSKFDLKGLAKQESKKGAGFNQFDPVLSVTTFVSRRFGLAGGLAVVALLASTEGNEILKAFQDKGPTAGSGEVITTSTGLAYKDVLVGTTGDQVGIMGSIVGIKAKVSIADKVLYDTAGDKPIAFRYGKRPFENILCDGVEQGVKGMKVGGVRELTVPAALAPKGLQAQLEAAGQPLTYTVEITEVLPGYF